MRWRPSLCLLLIGAFATLLSGGAMGAGGADDGAGSVSVERWTLVDEADGVGRMEWKCGSGGERIRFTDVDRTSRIAIRVGPSLYTKAWVQPHGRVDIPLGAQLQRWRVEPISAARPPVVVFRVRAAATACNRPHAAHHLVQPTEAE
jgi:hypothetical protein